MIKLLKIDFKKLRNYRTFWVLIILYFATMGLVTSSGMEFLKWLVSKGADFDKVDILRIPLYHFPDIWQNLTYVSLYFQLVLAIVVIISITNEFSYKTIRQNIIDGMDRKDFLASKVMMVLVLSLASTIFVFLIGLITGLIYTPATEMRFMFTGIEFIPAYFLATFSNLMLIMLFAIWIKRAGLTIGIVLIYPALEYAFGASLPDSLDPVLPYLPQHAINAIIKVPFQRYAFMEIQDYVDPVSVLVVVAYIVLFIFLSYRSLVKRDFN
jgi:hypothetical protein